MDKYFVFVGNELVYCGNNHEDATNGADQHKGIVVIAEKLSEAQKKNKTYIRQKSRRKETEAEVA